MVFSRNSHQTRQYRWIDSNYWLLITTMLTNKALAANYLKELIAIKNQVIPNHWMVMSLGTTVNTFAINERNKTAQQYQTEKTWIISDKIVWNTVHNRNPSSSHEFYTNVTVVDMDPQI